MPRWFEGMTEEDHAYNIEEIRQWRLGEGRQLRDEGEAMIRRANEIESLHKEEQSDGLG